MESQSEIFKHIRSGINGVKDALKNTNWTLEEIRSGGAHGIDGKVDKNGGSLLATINKHIAALVELQPEVFCRIGDRNSLYHGDHRKKKWPVFWNESPNRSISTLKHPTHYQFGASARIEGVYCSPEALIWAIPAEHTRTFMCLPAALTSHPVSSPCAAFMMKAQETDPLFKVETSSSGVKFNLAKLGYTRMIDAIPSTISKQISGNGSLVVWIPGIPENERICYLEVPRFESQLAISCLR